MGSSKPSRTASPADNVDEDDEPELTKGITIHIKSAFGAEQLFHLDGNVLKYRSYGGPSDPANGQALLSETQVEAIDALIRKARCGPLPQPDTIGLDGETVTVTIKQGQNRLELEYWEAPKPWKPIEKLVEIVR